VLKPSTKNKRQAERRAREIAELIERAGAVSGFCASSSAHKDNHPLPGLIPRRPAPRPVSSIQELPGSGAPCGTMATRRRRVLRTSSPRSDSRSVASSKIARPPASRPTRIVRGTPTIITDNRSRPASSVPKRRDEEDEHAAGASDSRAGSRASDPGGASAVTPTVRDPWVEQGIQEVHHHRDETDRQDQDQHDAINDCIVGQPESPGNSTVPMPG
jgi:hypothetical protein